MELDPIVQGIQDFSTLLLNGLLTVVYVCWERGPTVLSLVVAALVAVGPDRSVQRVAGHRPRRRQRGAVTRATPVAMIVTAMTAVVWAVAASLSRSPVPLWGLVMWVALLTGAWALPQERENVLWTHKGLILGYAAMAVGLRMIFQSSVNTAGWSEIMGVEQGGAALLAMVRQALSPWVVITVWAVYPIAYLTVLGQRLFINRTRLISPMASARDTFEALRTRGES